MSEGWPVVPLAELCSIKSGKSDTKDAVLDGPYMFFDRSKTPKKSSRFLFNCEALIIPGEGTEFLPRHFIGPFDLHQRAYALYDFSPRVNVRYLYYAFHQNDGYFPSVAVGATVKSLRLRHFQQFPVPLPPLSEQERIVRILDEALEGIATAQANIETNIANSEVLFQRSLDAIIEQHSAPAPQVTLEEVLDVQPRNGWSPPSVNHSSSGTPVLTLSSVTGFQFKREMIKFTSAATSPTAHYWVREGDLLMTRSNTPRLVGHVAIAAELGEPTIYPDLIMRMRFDETKMFKDYGYYVLRTGRSRTYLTSHAGGASQTMSKITKGIVQAMPIRVPSLESQAEAAAKIHAIEQACRTIEGTSRRKLDSLAHLRSRILTQALNGQR